MFWEPGPFSSFEFGIGAFFICLVIFHVCLVWLWPLSDIIWKKIDYIWLAFASLSLVTAIAQNRHLEAKQAIEFSQPYWNQLNTTILQTAIDERRYACETEFIKSEFSPKDFDELPLRYAKACNWHKKAIAIINSELKKPNANLRPELIPDDRSITDVVLRQNITQLYTLLGMQRTTNDLRFSWEAMLGQNNLEIMLTRLSPLLLAFAIALRMTKVTGEIQIARQRTQRPNPPSSIA